MEPILVPSGCRSLLHAHTHAHANTYAHSTAQTSPPTFNISPFCHLGQQKENRRVVGVSQPALASRPQDHWQAQSVGSCTV